MDDRTPIPSAPELAERLAAMGLEIEGALSVENHIAAFDALPPFAAYNRIPEGIEERLAVIAETGGKAAIETYHQLVLTTLVDGFEQRARVKGLPAWLKGPTSDYLQDILRSAASRRRRLKLEQDDFLKDLAVCRLKLWPLGVELVDVHAGLQKRIFTGGLGKTGGIGEAGGPGKTGGLRQALKAGLHVGLSLGGFRPFLETHFDSRRRRPSRPRAITASILRSRACCATSRPIVAWSAPAGGTTPRSARSAPTWLF